MEGLWLTVAISAFAICIGLVLYIFLHNSQRGEGGGDSAGKSRQTPDTRKPAGSSLKELERIYGKKG